MLALVAALTAASWPAAVNSCGAVLTLRNGLVQTPNFPNPFQVPIRCRWLIDSSWIPEPEVQIVVYLTQLFVTSGLTFTEYALYDPEDPNLQRNPTPLLSITEENSLTMSWLSTSSRFLVVELELDRLEGNHLRVLDHLLDVFGFNITYEMVIGVDSIRNNSCTVTHCSLAGNCYIDSEFQEFWCSCFPGFSGQNCDLGPICKPEGGPCLNGGVCRHAGKYPTCTCLDGFTGSRCEAAILDPRCEDEKCLIRCRLSGPNSTPCDCGGGQSVEERWRYIMTINVDNITSLSLQHPGTTLNNYLEKQIQKFFRSFSLSLFEDVKILNISDFGQVSFHFFGDQLDLSKVRLGQQKLSERRRIGEVILSGSPLILHHEQGLRLKEIEVNNLEVFENDQIILSCIAQGSEQMEFNWYKDGHPIDPFRGLGGLWMNILPKNSRDEYTAILGIDAAKVVDEGRYTCQVIDWEVQECKSLYLQVQSPPDVLLSPMAASVKKGDNIDLTCLSSNQKVSYSWTRDKNLFPLNPGSEFWEDLKPRGSILRVKNIQKSVTYTCRAQTIAGTREKSVHIDLLAPGSCKETEEFGIIWKSTSPGSSSMADCPPKYIGYSTRYCLSSSPGEAHWEEPDYSKCVSEILEQIINHLQVISRGTMKTNLMTLLSELYSWLRSRSPPYRGEGEPVVDFLSNVATFVNLTFASEEVLNVTKVFYANVDLLLSQPNSFINVEKVGKLQTLVDKWSLMWAHHLNLTAAYLFYSGMVIDIRKLSGRVSHQYNIPMLDSYPHWYTAHIRIEVISLRNQMNSVSIVNYQNISRFLPGLSSQILSDGSELLYEIQSNVISVSTEGIVEIRLDLTLPTMDRQNRLDWNMSCARAEVIGSEWDLDSCLSANGAGTSRRCICYRSGLYTMLLTRISSEKLEHNTNELWSPIVAVGCGSCLVQSCLALILLSCRRTFLQLLKVQFCLAVSSAMAIFVYVTRVVPSEDMYLLISTVLEFLFFFALSSQLGKLLIIYAEVVYLHDTKNAKLTVLGLIAGVTLLPCLISVSAESFSAKEFKSSWWLPIGSASFYIAVASMVCVSCLFFILSIGLLRRLHYLKAIKKPKSNHLIDRRLGLMKRTSALFAMTILVAISSIFFVNVPTSANIYIFSTLSAFLGFLMFVCYILHSESSLNTGLFKQLKITARDQRYNTGADYHVFNFFTKQESEVENKDVPIKIRESGSEMTEIPNNFLNKPKSVTFENRSAVEKKQQNVDLEVYRNSPKKCCQSPVNSICSSFDIIPQPNENYHSKVKVDDDSEGMQLLKVDMRGDVCASQVLCVTSHDLDN